MTIEKIIKEFVGKNLKDKASKVEQGFRKKGFDRDYIRIGVHATGRPNKREDIYFISSGGTIDEGPTFFSQGDSQYRTQNVGDIQVRVLYDNEITTIQIDRIIQSADEDMTYADNYEDQLFPNLTYEDRKALIEEWEKYGTIVECTECGEQFLQSQEAVEEGKYTPLNEQATEVICKRCAGDATIGEYLDSLGGADREQVKNYLLNYCGLEKSDPLVL